MPYIKLEDREKFKNHITEAVKVVISENVNQYTRGEYFGFFVNRLVRRFLGDPEYVRSSFNSTFFAETHRKTLEHTADSIAASINRSTPIESAGQLNYAISAVYWGVMGNFKDASTARYGMRAYLTGILEKIRSTIDTVNVGNQSDMTMAFRRHLVIRGVMDHVLDETYRRTTTPYEKQKMSENGDIWSEQGELL